MEQPTYRPRLVDAVLIRSLQAMGAVLIDGVKGCGKTATALQQARSAVRLDIDDEALRLGAIDPATLLQGEAPHLIDEWQRGPAVVWDLVRRAVDDRAGKGHFILTGSATPDDTTTRHSGAGRFGFVRMRTMTLTEKGATTPTVSLQGLLRGDSVEPARSDLTLADYLHHVVVGGWPDLIGADEDTAREFLYGYLATIIERDLPEVTREIRNPALVQRFLRSYAQATATATSMAKIVVNTADPGTDDAVARTTAAVYRTGLDRMRIIDDLDPWAPALRSAKQATQVPKRHLADPSLAAYLLGADSARLRRNLDTAGLLFESLAVHDLRVLAEVQRAYTYHHRTDGGRDEIDFVVETISGEWAGFEVKLGSDGEVEAAVSRLRRIEGSLSRPASSLVVITAHGIVETKRSTGKTPVHIIPLGAIGP